MDNNRKELSGLVHSASMDKTIVVNIVRSFPHPMYKKYVKFSKKYYVHDEKNSCEKGDSVLIEESKPLSKLKRWRVKKILKKAVKI
jgi:small subunit ribosomal protein S17|tara:strand:- start:1045 stop:1302 length:258 start_codon:yes stop_codon:yes gene_type:complete